MSTFSGLNTAYTGLVAARQGLDVVGQNIANLKTDGYTRQRVNTSATPPLANTGLLTGGIRVGQGVSVDAIARLGDAQLDARVRGTAAIAAYSDVRATAMSALESTLHEPGPNGVSAQLQAFWAAWQDVSNNAGQDAEAGVLIQQGGVIAAQVAQGYQDVVSQWSDLRGQVDGMVADVNSAAAQIATLNGTIRTTLAAGGSANELLDQRSTLTTTIASLAGGTVREAPDGTVDVLIGGNAIVSGTAARPLTVLGDPGMAGAATNPVRIEWAHNPAMPVSLDGGKLAGALSMLAPAVLTGPGQGTGGPIAEAAEGYNAFAVDLASKVNAIHETGVLADGTTTGLDFFALDAALPPALGLSVIPTGAAQIAAGAAGAGGRDGSIADQISQLGIGSNSPDATWSTLVTKIASDTKTELQRSALADLAATSAATMQLSNASVDIDEENVNLLSFQHAYQGAARVLTAVDEMLDTLINHTGIVGR